MTKETIPQSIIDKINKEADDHAVIMSEGLNSHAFNMLKDTFRQAAIWSYGLSEGRIKELEGDNEKLKAETAINSPLNWELNKIHHYYKQLFEEKRKLDKRIEELEASDKWISVKDGLPEELVDVLVCMKRLNSDNYYFIVADYYEGQWNAGDKEDLDNNPDFYVVTHYQYLPKPPKDI